MAAASELTLPDGSRLLVRAIRPGDRDSVSDGFERLGPQSRHSRFHAPPARLDGAALRYLTDVDHHDHEALIAFDAATGASVGVARFVRAAGADWAEVAVTVVDEWQGRGAGTALLEHLAQRARQEGVRAFRAYVLASNRAARAVLGRLGQVREAGRDGEVTELEVRFQARS